MRNVIVTGIPRSGTTLTAALIDGLTDCVCLNEPHWQAGVQLGHNPQTLASWLADDYARIRQHLLAEHPVPDRRSPDGGAITDFFEADKQPAGGQMALFIRAGLTENFTLAMKHNALYMAALPHLAAMGQFTIIALLRHPVHVIASWRRLSLPVSEGRLPHGATYWPEIKHIMQTEPDILTRQVKLYDTLCKRLHDLREAIHVLPYEKLIETPDTLCSIIKHDGPINNALIKKDIPATTEEEHGIIQHALRRHGQHWQQFYPDIGKL